MVNIFLGEKLSNNKKCKKERNMYIFQHCGIGLFCVLLNYTLNVNILVESLAVFYNMHQM